jgi:hypothetical protein
MRRGPRTLGDGAEEGKQRPEEGISSVAPLSSQLPHAISSRLQCELPYAIGLLGLSLNGGLGFNTCGRLENTS